MTSKKQIIANKENAKKGGVKSQEGKNKIKLNAVKHGITSNIYNRELEKQIIEEYNVSGTLEKMMVQHTCISRARYERGICLENKLIMNIVSPPKYEKVYDSKEDGENYITAQNLIANNLLKSSLLGIEPPFRNELVEGVEFGLDTEKIEYLVGIIGKYNHQNEVQLNKSLNNLINILNNKN